MQKVAAVAVGLVVAFGTLTFAKEETIKGRLVDMACYQQDKKLTGNTHPGMGDTCAQDCAKKGLPVAIVTDEGKVYTVAGEVAANKNEKLVGHMAHVVELTGEVSELNGKTTITASQLKMISK